MMDGRVKKFPRDVWCAQPYMSQMGVPYNATQPRHAIGGKIGGDPGCFDWATKESETHLF